MEGRSNVRFTWAIFIYDTFSINAYYVVFEDLVVPTNDWPGKRCQRHEQHGCTGTRGVTCTSCANICLAHGNWYALLCKDCYNNMLYFLIEYKCLSKSSNFKKMKKLPSRKADILALWISSNGLFSWTRRGLLLFCLVWLLQCQQTLTQFVHMLL